MKSLLGIILIILIASQCVNADSKDPNDPNYPNDPRELLRVKWNAIITVLQNKEIDQDVKEKKINKIVASEEQEREVTVGDIIYIPAGEKHRHGAGSDSEFSHIYIKKVGSKTDILGD